jgi:hypothetical protein
MAVPVLSAEQRARVGEGRSGAEARGELLEGLRAGATSLAGVFEQAAAGEEIVRRTRMSQVLRVLPGFGPAKVAAFDGDLRGG